MKHRERRRRTGWLIVCLATSVIAGGVALLIAHKTAAEKLIRSAASERWRPIEGRLSGFAHKPRPARARVDLPILRSVARAIMIDPRRETHTSAVATLLYGRSAEAEKTLETLVSREPQNPNDWNDLAVARLEDGATNNDVRMIALSLAAADHALTLQPAHVEALFNRALALDALGLRFASTEAWRRYLAIDPGSEWSVEARERLAVADVPTREQAWKHDEAGLLRALDRSDITTINLLVARYPQQARTEVETIHLPAWGNALLTGNASLANTAFNRARLIAAALKQHNGDGLLEQVVGKLSERAAKAFREYGQGRADNTARKIESSMERFTEAERDFAAAGNPMELSAAYFRANALVDLGKDEESEAIAKRIEPRLEPLHRSLLAHLFWLKARHTNDAGHHYESLLATRSAREIFEQLGELDYADRLRTAEAAMLARLGRDREAWQNRRIALAGAAASGKWNMVEIAIEAIAREEVDGPDHDIARSLFNVQVAAPSALPLMRFNGLLWSAFLDARNSGHSPDLTLPRNAAAHIPDAKQRDDAMDELRLSEALAIRITEPSASERLLSEVIDYRTRAGLMTYLPAIHLERARIRRKSLDISGAEEDLRRAIELIESRRERIQNDTLRDAFLGRSEDAYNELGDLLLSLGGWMGAFEVSEKARARVLADKTGHKALSAAELISQVPEGVVEAHYTSFPSRTLLVLVEHGRAMHYVIDIDRSALSALRDQLALNPDSKPTARRLYDLLIAPIRDRLSNDRLLVIGPDEMTYGIPFAGLLDSNNRYLIEETSIAFAPASTAISNQSLTLLPKQSKATIVADPAFSQALFPRLDRLRSAHYDAGSMRKMFGQTTVLIGDDAKIKTLASAARTCDVLHLAAHAFSSPRDSSLSLIALTPEEGDEGLLYLDDVSSLVLQSRPLVVLAGCQTGSFGGGKGSIRSLAFAFLAAGSRAVLATLWKVDDDATSALTTAFYRSLTTGKTLPNALREAQLKAMRSQPPHEWAAFQLFLGIKPAVRESTGNGRLNEH